MKALFTFLLLLTMSLVPVCLGLTDGLLLTGAGTMVLVITGALKIWRKSLRPLTRWAKAHPKSIWFISAILQLCLGCLGLLGGYNLFQMGVGFSSTGIWLGTGLSILGLSVLPLLPQKRQFILPATYNRQQWAIVSTSLGIFMLMLVFGNQLEERHPGTRFTQAIQQIDKGVMDQLEAFVWTDEDEADLEKQVASAQSATIIRVSMKNPSQQLQAEREQRVKRKKARKRLRRHLRGQFGAWICALSVLLIIALSVTLCAGICLIILSGSAGGVLGGIALTAFSIWGIVVSIRLCGKGIQNDRRSRREERGERQD